MSNYTNYSGIVLISTVVLALLVSVVNGEICDATAQGVK